MGINPFDAWNVKPKPDPEPLNQPEERLKLTNLAAGERGQRCAHESTAILRMHRAGFTAGQTCDTLGITQRVLKHEFKFGLDLETDAAGKGMPIYDARIPKTAQ